MDWDDKIVQLTLEVEEMDVLLSDFDLYHYVLNYCYLAEDEEDNKRFEKEYTDLGYNWNDLKNFNIQSQSMKQIRNKIEKSWDRIFDLNCEDMDYIYGSNAKKSIQATCWEIRFEQLMKAEILQRGKMQYEKIYCST